MHRLGLTSLCLVGACLLPRVAFATKSAELYTTTSYPYGRFESRIRFAAGNGVVSAFFLWKDGSEKSGTFWNELDYEKIDADCKLDTNALFGNPGANHNKTPSGGSGFCTGFHTYGYEWTADYISWTFDGMEVRRETGETATAFAQNATAGMQYHFNVWVGDSTFGGTLDPSILPVFQYVDWVQFSTYANGAFTLAWREDFDAATLPTGWATGTWDSSKGLSTHDPLNVNFVSSCAVLSMTADGATGVTGADPTGCTPGMGSGGAAGAAGAAGAPAQGGAGGAAAGASAGGASSGGATAPGGSGGTNAAGAAGGAGGMTAAAGTGAGATSPTGGMGAVAAGSSGVANPGAGMSGAPSGTGGATGGSSTMGGSATGGNPAGAGTGAEAAAGHASKDDDASGCGCRVPGSNGSSQRGSVAGAALVLALAGAFRRRRASRVGG